MFEDIDPRSPKPLWDQISTRVRIAIASGELHPGESLPSVRELARRLRVNPATVARAYKELALEGFAETRQGSGTFIREVSGDRQAEERHARATELVRRMLEDGARLGIGLDEITVAFQKEVGSEVHG